jgi:hypothetical protein
MKIGITLDMSVAFWSNGMQQNIVFLYSLLSKAGHDCYYISKDKPAHELHKDHKGMLLEDLINDRDEVLDVLIIGGFSLLPDMYQKLKRRNSEMKTVLVHFGNKLMDDINYGICAPNGPRVPVVRPDTLDQVWISPHHDFAKEYIKTYYKTENVHIAPYIWDSFFVDEKIELLREKSLSPYFRSNDVNKVCIFEPNISFLKNCVIPLSICERFNQMFPDELESVNAFGCEKLRVSNFFQKLMHKFSIVDETKKCFFNNRWGSLDALSKFGSTVVSHQMYNELNYSHIEALYLGVPLIHNSPRLQDVGYYYPDFDVEMGAKQLKSAIENHASTISAYKKDAQEFIKQYSPYSTENTKAYLRLIENG